MNPDKEDSAEGFRDFSHEDRAAAREEREVVRDARDVRSERHLLAARQYTRVTIAVIGLFALAALVFVIVLFLPYTPMTVYSYQIMPDVACPNQLLRTQIDFEIDRGEPISSAESQAVWTAVDVKGYSQGERLPLETASIPVEQLKAGRREVKGKILRPAPVAPGEWRFGAVLTLHGRSVTQLQRLTPTAEHTTEVLLVTSPTCKGAQ